MTPAYSFLSSTVVQTSLNLVMPQGEINITVDNLTPLMKGLELDTGDEDVKDVILEALLDCECIRHHLLHTVITVRP